MNKNIIPFNGGELTPKKMSPTYLNVNIKIRADLITHWGGLVINNFAVNPKTNELLAENVMAPGFIYETPTESDEATFTITTEMGEKNVNKKRAARKKTTHKKL